MSAPGWAQWYVLNHLHFLQDGLDYWWNDEGETQWFTYTWWNAAQKAMVDAVLPGKRHFTINRSFQAGMQTFPAITWTGDRQDCSHATVLTFTVAGQLYTACDMTAPSASVLVRQYWNAVFLPIMRTHAMHGTPRFPFLWGDGAEAGFRAALNTRYHFLPHIYSLMHLARRTGAPLALPASYIFPNDPAFPVSVGDRTYMFSDVLLPADVSTSNGPDPNENTTHVNIPSGTWYAYNSTATLVGPILDRECPHARRACPTPAQVHAAPPNATRTQSAPLRSHVHGRAPRPARALRARGRCAHAQPRCSAVLGRHWRRA